MELREYAERVLFGKGFEEKLILPVSLSDDDPGSPVLKPVLPERPEGFQFSPRRAERSFPSPKNLESESDRFLALAHFANHELLAAELMALMILKFPDAPKDFRVGLKDTLKEEIMHARLYLNRLNLDRSGLDPGGASDYFWRIISDVETPMDYVTRLSLTFEQANLDYTRHFENQFRRIGDSSTAAVLKKIGEDEIRHVAFGLRWFRIWKPRDSNDWEHFKSRLVFPLSPSRAKGIGFNEQARIQAGLDPSYIQELRLFSQSKGRCPDVYWFNPGGEWTTNRPRDRHLFDRLREDLSVLPICVAGIDDLVLVSREISNRHRDYLQKAGLDTPAQVVLNEGNVLSRHPLLSHKLSRFIPWAGTPDCLPLYDQLKKGSQNRIQPFEPIPIELFNKSIAHHRIVEFCRTTGLRRDWMPPARDFGTVETSFGGVHKAVSVLRESGVQRIVFKAPFGLSGRGQLRLFEPVLKGNQAAWVDRILSEQGSVMVQPWFTRLVDFSIQIAVKPQRTKVVGYAHLINDARGQFAAVECYPDYKKRLPYPARAFFSKTDTLPHAIAEFYRGFAAYLCRPLEACGYQGPACMDAFLYRTVEGGLKIMPASELNPRHTFGTLAMGLMKRVRQGLVGALQLGTLSKTNNEAVFAEAIDAASPEITREGQRILWGPGNIQLNEVNPESVFSARFVIRSTK